MPNLAELLLKFIAARKAVVIGFCSRIAAIVAMTVPRAPVVV